MTGKPSNISSVDPIDLLSNTELFRHLNPNVLQDLASELDLVMLKGGETLMREEDPGDCMYTVINGRLHTFIHTNEDTEKYLGEIGSGESVGEMALITGEDRSATVKAARDSELVKISKTGFDRLMQKHPEAMMEIARVIVTRMRGLMHTFGPINQLKTVAVIPSGSGVDVSGFAKQLSLSMDTLGRVFLLSKKVFEDIHGKGSAGLNTDRNDEKEIEIAAWLYGLESSYEFVLYEADNSLSSWTSCCIRQADRILLVGFADSNPSLNEIERTLFAEDENKILAAKELILLHPDKQKIPKGTRHWLGLRKVKRHHHVCLNNQADFEKLARLLSGRGVGLVLGGGGARGFAHIGVIRALEEANFPIDMICGVSMGAILAAQYAMGMDWKTMLERTRSGVAENKIERDMTLPLISINRGKKIKNVLESFYRQIHIEDLWLNYFSVSCNLSNAETVVHHRGLLWRAVSASNAAPGVMPPIIEDGSLLVDGGIVNNQPGDIMKEHCEGPVLVVNVSPDKDMTVDASFREMPSPWSLLWSRISPFRESIHVPNIPAVIMRTIMVSSHKKAREVEIKADYYLRPPLNHFKINDYAKIIEIVEAGYVYASEQIRGWEKAGSIPH